MKKICADDFRRGIAGVSEGKPKAIETYFDGYRFRSRLEARYAVMFKALEIKYEYEPEGYDLDGELYLPDFLLPEVPLWVEVKGRVPNEREARLAQKLATATDTKVMLAFIPPWEMLIDRTESGNWLYVPKGKVTFYNAFLSICVICRRVGISAFGDPRWVLCQCVSRAIKIAEAMTADELQKLTSPDRIAILYDLKTKGLDAFAGALDSVAGVLSKAALSAKQARFEHGQKG